MFGRVESLDRVGTAGEGRLPQMRDIVRLLETLSEDDLLGVLGAALAEAETGVAPVDPARLKRFARLWLESRGTQLWQRIRDTDTYRLWLASAGTEQVPEAEVVADALVEHGVPPAVAGPTGVALHRRETGTTAHYDIAVSCAEQDADYVGRVVAAARAEHLRVFYDRDMTYAWWGRNFLAEGRRIYGRKTSYFVPFISRRYLVEPGTRDAFESAMLTAAGREGFILPVLVGDVEVPAEMLHPHIFYLRAQDHSPERLAQVLAIKVAETKDPASPRDVGLIVRGAHDRHSA